jgi:trimethylamine-N-oxide reductase cytochrome c-type subunit TorC
MKRFLTSLRQFFLRPSASIGLGVLVAGGFVAGIVSWHGFDVALTATNQEEFCVGCHTMADNVLPELKETVHWSNRTGVRARCADCHVPHDLTDKLARKMQASREVLSHLMGDIGTPEKFQERRLTLARREWARFEANGSKECRNCHDYASMDFSKMKPAAQVSMRDAAERNQSCISCHKGIAHHLPDVKSEHNPAFDPLVATAAGLSAKAGGTYYVATPQPLYADAALAQPIGAVEVATAVKVLAESGDAQNVEMLLWRKNKGFGRVWYGDFGLNINSTTLVKDVSRDDRVVSVLASREDPLTGLEWQQVKASGWIRKGALVDSLDPIWTVARGIYSTSCSVCHRQPEETHFDANTWPGMFGGMVGFTSMDDATAKVVLKYLQYHSSDFAKATH